MKSHICFYFCFCIKGVSIAMLQLLFDIDLRRWYR